MEGADISYADRQRIDNAEETLFGGPNAPSRTSRGTHTSGVSKHLDVEELEMLLEAYFVQIDGTLNKLSTVCTHHPILLGIHSFKSFPCTLYFCS